MIILYLAATFLQPQAFLFGITPWLSIYEHKFNYALLPLLLNISNPSSVAVLSTIRKNKPNIFIYRYVVTVAGYYNYYY